MAIAEITFIPIGTQSTSCSLYIAKALDVLAKETDITYELHAMGTIISAASLQKLYAVIAKMQEALFENDIARLYTVIKIDDRRDKSSSFAEKVESVKAKREQT